jgi:hypothetical protein
MKKLSLDALRAKAQVMDTSVLEKISGGNKENCHCVETIHVVTCTDTHTGKTMVSTSTSTTCN